MFALIDRLSLRWSNCCLWPWIPRKDRQYQGIPCWCRCYWMWNAQELGHDGCWCWQGWCFVHHWYGHDWKEQLEPSIPFQTCRCWRKWTFSLHFLHQKLIITFYSNWNLRLLPRLSLPWTPIWKTRSPFTKNVLALIPRVCKAFIWRFDAFWANGHAIDIYNDEFFDALSGVTNALDNVEARK